MNYLPKPKFFVMQWHITERCNWNCKHCYQNKNYTKEELSTEQLFSILDQYLFLIKKLGLPNYCARINVTGGEPFIRKDFFKLAEKLGSFSDFFHWGVLSNGSFATKVMAKKLRIFNMAYYQISLEGIEKNNDEIRGEGTFNKITDSIKLLVDAGIRVNVSLTLTKGNIKDIPAIVELCDELGIANLNIRRLITSGRGSALKKDMLEPKELREHYFNVLRINEDLKKRNSTLRIKTGCESGIFNDELPSIHKTFCGVINGRILTVMPNGDILPCRRLPLTIGNVLKQSLSEAYYTNELLELRNLNNAHSFCKNCKNFNSCFGGAKCITYCCTNKLFIPDPQCWKFYQNLRQQKL